NRLRELEADKILKRAGDVLDDLDDLCVLLLFSVFETLVRERVRSDVAKELPASVQHPSLRSAVEDLHEAIDHGSFFRVLDPFKLQVGPGLVEEVHQVRK